MALRKLPNTIGLKVVASRTEPQANHKPFLVPDDYGEPADPWGCGKTILMISAGICLALVMAAGVITIVDWVWDAI